MRVTLDEEVDAAYIYFQEKLLGPIKTVTVDGILPWMINLDFDADGRLYGMEVLDARQLLPAEFLDRFAKPS
jgi:uncharacterized protein YuzE